MQGWAALALGLVLLTACAPRHEPAFQGPVFVMVPHLPDECGLADQRDLIGHPFTALAGRQILSELRVVRQGEVVTSEVLPRRINALVDRKGVILRLFCG